MGKQFAENQRNKPFQPCHYTKIGLKSDKTGAQVPGFVQLKILIA